MKHLFLSMAAVAMLASCSSEEVLDKAQTPKSAIGFSTFVDKSTRGAENDIETGNISAFQVWGLMQKDTPVGKPFIGVTVNREQDGSGNWGNWGYITPVYWENGYKYSFNAIAPASNNTNTWTYTPPTDIGEQGSIVFTNGDGTMDLIHDYDGTYAESAVSTTNAVPDIAFTFAHLLSRVKFQFTNSMDDGSVINVTSVEINNANKKGTVTLSTKAWALSKEQNNTFKLTFGNVLLENSATSFAASTTKQTDHKYMIPTETNAYTVNFTVTRTFNGGVTETYTHSGVPLPSTEMVAGNSYLFGATLSSGTIDPAGALKKINFTVTSVSDWGAFGTENTITLPKP